jgi:protein tyrosine phosphatase
MHDGAQEGSTVRRLLAVHHTVTHETRTIYHWQFANWPDFGTPQPRDFLAFHSQVARSWQNTQSPRGPVLVHCSAGVGRTGTFIAVDWCYIFYVVLFCCCFSSYVELTLRSFSLQCAEPAREERGV